MSRLRTQTVLGLLAFESQVNDYDSVNVGITEDYQNMRVTTSSVFGSDCIKIRVLCHTCIIKGCT